MGILSCDRNTAAELSSALATATARAGDLWGAPALRAKTNGRLTFDLDVESLHANWGDRVRHSLVAIGLPAPDIPTLPMPRRPGADVEALSAILEQLRSVRTGNPDCHYEVYR